MNPRKVIKIEVKGFSNTGKTTLAILIEDMLTHLGFDVELEDVDINTMSAVQLSDWLGKQPARVKDLAKKDMQIKIETMNVSKNSLV